MAKSFFTRLCCFLLCILPGCGHTSPEEPGIFRFQDTMTVDGRARTWLVNLPPGYYARDAEAFPLVIGLHGTGGNAAQFERDYRFSQLANRNGFVAVYPEGVQNEGRLGVRTWNAGSCCDYAKEHQVNDVQFISLLIDKLVADHKIDPRKVYVAGMSNGGMLAYRLACEIPHKIAAIAAVSCSMMVAQPCNPSRPVPVLHLHSALDTKIPYNGGVALGGYYYPPVDSVLGVWASLHGCAGAEVLTDDARYKFTRWSGCSTNAPLESYLTRDGGHAWPGGQRAGSWGDPPSTVINANELLWAFFQRFSLP